MLRNRVAQVVALLVAVSVVACELSSRPSSQAVEGKAGYDAVARDRAPASALAEGTVNATESGAPLDRTEPWSQTGSDATATAMIIRTGQASIEIDSLEPAIAQIRALAARVGGYLANSQVQAGRNQLRSATLEIKVPASRFDELVSGLSPLGRLEYVNISAQDVGEEFTDITARVANAHRLEQRLIELLATRTGKLSDVLEIERELARVREEIERMEGRLRYLKAHVATSTLSVTVHEKVPLVGNQGSGSVIGAAFQQSWRNFVGFVAGLIASLGTLVPLSVLGLGLLFGLRRVWRSRR